MTVRGHHTRTPRSVQREFRHDLNAFKSVLALEPGRRYQRHIRTARSAAEADA